MARIFVFSPSLYVTCCWHIQSSASNFMLVSRSWPFRFWMFNQDYYFVLTFLFGLFFFFFILFIFTLILILFFAHEPKKVSSVKSGCVRIESNSTMWSFHKAENLIISIIISFFLLSSLPIFLFSHVFQSTKCSRDESYVKFNLKKKKEKNRNMWDKDKISDKPEQFLI